MIRIGSFYVGLIELGILIFLSYVFGWAGFLSFWAGFAIARLFSRKGK